MNDIDNVDILVVAVDALVVGRAKLDRRGTERAVVRGVRARPLVSRQALLVPDVLDVLLEARDQLGLVVGVVALGDPVIAGLDALDTALGDQGVDRSNDFLVLAAIRQANVDAAGGRVRHLVDLAATLDDADVGGAVVDDVANARGADRALGDGARVLDGASLGLVIVTGNSGDLVDEGDDLRELVNSVIALVVAGRAVAGHAMSGEREVENALLANLNRVVAGGLADHDGISTIGIAVLAEPLGARAGNLLIADDVQADITLEVNVSLIQHGHREEQDREAALHVRGTAAEHLAVADLAAERIEVPAIKIANGHDVNVTVQDDAEALIGANASIDDRVVLATVRNEALRLDAVLGKVVTNELDSGLLVINRALVLYLDELLAKLEQIVLVSKYSLVKLLLRNRHFGSAFPQGMPVHGTPAIRQTQDLQTNRKGPAGNDWPQDNRPTPRPYRDRGSTRRGGCPPPP